MPNIHAIDDTMAFRGYMRMCDVASALMIPPTGIQKASDLGYLHGVQVRGVMYITLDSVTKFCHTKHAMARVLSTAPLLAIDAWCRAAPTDAVREERITAARQARAHVEVGVAHVGSGR